MQGLFLFQLGETCPPHTVDFELNCCTLIYMLFLGAHDSYNDVCILGVALHE